ncbi:MAG: TetR/AcrR family transcriptional regulator [Pseudomonadales bacterium]
MKRLTAQDWIDEAFRDFACGGVDRVRVERLAASLGVTKGSFYWHFKNRQELLDAMLSHWEETGTKRIIERVDAAVQDPRDRIKTLIEFAMVVSETEAAIDAKLRVWAATDDKTAAVLARVDKRRVGYVVQLFRAIGVTQPRHRATALYRMMIGEYTWRTAGNAKASHAFIQTAVALILAPDR